MALAWMAQLTRRVQQAYQNYEFHLVFHRLHQFCSVEMSAIYLDILKDRLYVSRPDSPARRSAQSTLYELLLDLTRLMAPILSFTAEEIWTYLPGAKRQESVHLASFPEPRPGLSDAALLAKYEFLLKVRDEINRGLEEARKGKVLATAQEARVTLGTEDAELLGRLNGDAEALKILSQVAVLTVMDQPASLGQALAAQEIPGLFVQVDRAAGEKCVRCWFTLASVGEDRSAPPNLSPLPSGPGGVMSRKIVLFSAILVIGVFLDQFTKYLVVRELAEGSHDPGDQGLFQHRPHLQQGGGLRAFCQPVHAIRLAVLYRLLLAGHGGGGLPVVAHPGGPRPGDGGLQPDLHGGGG